AFFLQHEVGAFDAEGAVIEDSLLMGADYYETDADRELLAAKGRVPIGNWQRAVQGAPSYSFSMYIQITIDYVHMHAYKIATQQDSHFASSALGSLSQKVVVFCNIGTLADLGTLEDLGSIRVTRDLPTPTQSPRSMSPVANSSRVVDANEEVHDTGDQESSTRKRGPRGVNLNKNILADSSLRKVIHIDISSLNCTSAMYTNSPMKILQAHPWLTECEREHMCKLMNIQKLSLGATTHTDQNERLPFRVPVQVLFCEQLRLRTSIAGWFLYQKIKIK
ncbi:BTB/POZ domain-containing protein-like protein, partial [Tanacetum coccineum]